MSTFYGLVHKSLFGAKKHNSFKSCATNYSFFGRTKKSSKNNLIAHSAEIMLNALLKTEIINSNITCFI